MQYLIPVDQSRVHPSRTFDECVAVLLDGAGVPRNRIIFDVSEGEPTVQVIKGKEIAVGTTVLTAQRRCEHDLEAAYLAADDLIEALYRVDLAGYCELPCGDYARLPGDYWRNIDLRDDPDPALAVHPVGKDVPGEAVGRLILLDQDHFDKWSAGGAIARLSARLKASPVIARPAPKRAPSSRMRRLAEFFDLARSKLPDGSRPVSAVDLEAEYQSWNARQPGGLQPFATSRFKELRERWVRGDRW